MAMVARRRSLIGEKIGNYSIVSTLGEGGMGVVYLAEHPIIGRRVAIKVLHDGGARAEAAARCFVEARAIGELRHPNVVDVIDCGVAELGDGPVHYLVMEHLEGRSLRDDLKAGALPAARAIAIAAEVGRALAAAHAKGIVHRDIKPENIFLVGPAAAAEPATAAPSERPRVKILDFGIAKLLDGHPFGAPLTQSGMTLGTPTYMAPEQLDGEDLDGRVDVYALGIVLFEMLTGAAPFADEPTARGVWRRMNEVPALPAGLELPSGVEELLLRALDPDRVRRPAMSELVRGLDDPAAAEVSADDPHTRRVPRAAARAREALPAPAPPARAAPRRRWLPVAAVGLVVGAAAALLVPRLWREGEAGSAAPAPSPVLAPAPEPARFAAPPRRDEPAPVRAESEVRSPSPAPAASAMPPAAGPVPAKTTKPSSTPATPPTAAAAKAPSTSPAPASAPQAMPAAAVPDAGTPPSPPPPPDAGPPRGLGDNLLPPRERP